MHEVWRELRLRKNRVERMSSIQNNVVMRQARLVPGKHGMASIMLVLKESVKKKKFIPVHIQQWKTASK